MTNADQNTVTTAAVSLEKLKEQANELGITFHPNIKEEALQVKIDRKLEEQGVEPDQDFSHIWRKIDPVPRPELSERQKKMKAIKDANRLVRVTINCQNPHKRGYKGQIFQAGNALVPTVKKYVPFNTPWLVPHILVEQIEQYKCQDFRTERDELGREYTEGFEIKEFAVAYLPELTEQEFEDLKKKQAVAGNIG